MRVLDEHLLDREKVVLNTAIRKIEQSSEGVVAHCENGDTIEGDIAVGADGVWSLARREMWRHAEEAGDGKLFANDKTGKATDIFR